MLPWEPDVQLILCVHCRSDNSTGGRHPGLIGALPEGSKTQPKQCLQRETSRQITVRILELGLGGSLGGMGEGRGVEGGRKGWEEGGRDSRAGHKDCVMGPDLLNLMA